jgi:hypothetical protein
VEEVQNKERGNAKKEAKYFSLSLRWSTLLLHVRIHVTTSVISYHFFNSLV